MSSGDTPQGNLVGSGASDPSFMTPVGGMRTEAVERCRLLVSRAGEQVQAVIV
ncbi:hypothetical protein [Micromonospora sp. NBC_00858]|uniref:hypothetical protein n=1 Tax=Micromonospora sp. NBC_00858 TaxID=2975979 RepID=UPI003870867D|nr:hypothetical protein OG990_16140 [Micromonospora sp. NBC_00858]